MLFSVIYYYFFLEKFSYRNIYMLQTMQKALAAGLDEATLKKMLALLPQQNARIFALPVAKPKRARKQRPDNVADEVAPAKKAIQFPAKKVAKPKEVKRAAAAGYHGTQ